MMSSDPLEFGDNYQPGTFILDGSLMSDALGGDINMSNYDFINPTAADTAATNLSALFHSDLAQNDGDNTADSQIRVSASFSTMQVSDVMLTAASSQHYLIPRQDSVPASQSSMVVISAQPSSAPGQTGQVIHMLNPVSTVSLPVSNSTQPQAIVARTGLSPSQMSPILVERLHSSVHVMRSMPSTNGHVVQRVHAPDPRSDVQNDYPKPQFSYSCLIALALKNSESGSLPVRDIYKFMTTHFPYYKTARDGWKNSVRHNLSMNKCFEKLGDPTRATGSKKGSHWRMIPAKRGKMEDEINKSKNKDIDGLRRSMAYPEKLELIEQGRAGIPRDRMGPIARQPRTPSSCSNSSAGSGQVESPPNIPDNMETILEGDLFSTIPEMSDVTNWIQSNQNDVIDMLNADGTPPSPTQVLGLGNSQGSQGPMSPMTLSQFTIPNALNLQIQPHEGSDSRSSADVLSPSPGGVMTSSYPPSPSALLNGSQLSPLDFGQQSPLGGLLGRGAHSPLGLGRSSSRNHHHIFDFPDIPHSPQMAMQPPSRPSSQGGEGWRVQIANGVQVRTSRVQYGNVLGSAFDVQNNPVPSTSFGVQNASVPATAWGVQNNSVPSTSFGVQNASVPATGWGVQNNPVPSTSFGVQNASVPATAWGVQNNSVPSTSCGVQNASVPATAWGVQNNPVPSTSFGVQNASVPATGWGVQNNSVPATAGGVQNNSVPTSCGVQSIPAPSTAQNFTAPSTSCVAQNIHIPQSAYGVQATQVHTSMTWGAQKTQLHTNMASGTQNAQVLPSSTYGAQNLHTSTPMVSETQNRRVPTPMSFERQNFPVPTLMPNRPQSTTFPTPGATQNTIVPTYASLGTQNTQVATSMPGRTQNSQIPTPMSDGTQTARAPIPTSPPGGTLNTQVPTFMSSGTQSTQVLTPMPSGTPSSTVPTSTSGRTQVTRVPTPMSFGIQETPVITPMPRGTPSSTVPTSTSGRPQVTRAPTPMSFGIQETPVITPMPSGTQNPSVSSSVPIGTQNIQGPIPMPCTDNRSGGTHVIQGQYCLVTNIGQGGGASAPANPSNANHQDQTGANGNQWAPHAQQF